MQNPHNLPDMHIFSLKGSGGRLELLRNSDHLLRRFGQLEMLHLQAGESRGPYLRAVADEIIFIIEGALQVALLDRREGSPSRGRAVRLQLNAAEPQGLLIPFGVLRSFETDKSARLLRLSTHLEEEDESLAIDEELHSEDLA